ncbi:hypothetical protein VTK73DRAFT_574 [Phialemonium thermophilum]|uniref:Methyltransferase type 11 domain-containing protein n=1 Tax=Phialemonium thermophilum TaxID=223376 RepID=A0ABR3XED1_9PEZI
MADTKDNKGPATQESTFRKYNEQQGKAYAQHRRDYNPSVYQAILDHHTSTGGQLGTVIDVGCGPGNAVRSLAPHFAHAIGIDPSEGMIAAARDLSTEARTTAGESVFFKLSTAEDLGGPDVAPDGGVDLITAATAAHWFDMARFWPRAARALRPGGSVAIWCATGLRVHPSTPAAESLQIAVDEHTDTYLKPYFVRGNFLVEERYEGLELPWTLPEEVRRDHPELSVFDKADFYHRVWSVDEHFYGENIVLDLDGVEKVLSTASPVTRWREAHPNDVGTERDVMKVLRRKMEEILHGAGVERGKEQVSGATEGVMLIIKKKASGE